MFVSPHYVMANYVMALQSNHCTLVVAPQRTCRFIALRSVSGLTKRLYYPSVQPGRPLLYSLLQVGIQERRLFIPRSWDTHKGESLVVLDQNKQTNKCGRHRNQQKLKGTKQVYTRIWCVQQNTYLALPLFQNLRCFSESIAFNISNNTKGEVITKTVSKGNNSRSQFATYLHFLS